MAEIVLKELSYQFDTNSPQFIAAYDEAAKTVREDYMEEQAFQAEECQNMIDDGDIDSVEEYKRDYLGLTDSQVDYLKPFGESIGHPAIQQKIENKAQEYMRNILDLPKTMVVTIDDQFVDSKGRPSETEAYKAAEKALNGAAKISGCAAAGVAEKKDILTQKAFDSVTHMMDSHEYQSFLQLRASVQKYSHRNICLIYAQEPNAKAVMGLRAWNQYDRHVQAGQHGIAIWQPTTSIKKSEKSIDAYIDSMCEKYPKLYPDASCPAAVKLKEKLMKELNEKGQAEVDAGYRLGTVFDISQTVANDPTKDNLQDIINLNKPLNGSLDNYDAVLKSMTDAAVLHPLKVDKTQNQQEGLFNALLEYADTVLRKTPDKVNGIKSDTPMQGDMHKIETVMAAYMIAEHIGIETGDKAGLKLAEVFDRGTLSKEQITVGRREMFMQAFDRGAKLSDMFVKEFDKSYGIDIEAQREAVKQETAQKKQDYMDEHIRLGRLELTEVDRWESGTNQYVVGRNDKNDTYYVRVHDTDENKYYFLKNDDGHAMKFSGQPDRDEVQQLNGEPAVTKNDKEME